MKVTRGTGRMEGEENRDASGQSRTGRCPSEFR